MDLLNNEVFERMRLIDTYVINQQRLASLLAEAGICISKAKSLNGIALTSVICVDTLDLEPTKRIEVTEATWEFKISKVAPEEGTVVNRKRKDDDADKSNEEKGKQEKDQVHKGSFRPFGILEPMPAKEARALISEALEVICALATTRAALEKANSEVSKRRIEIDDDVMQMLKTIAIEK